ncbi:pilin [Blautia faecis]|uniref:type IV pilin protein n=1 Tax=Blautia faecis TaxID=871665 RepID=UPI0016555C9B|nr:prepilin-type N-terminal cleavage/methylation domain-containing protein [Blautia faecis]MBC8614016.1 pilin [Blautia faecis]
MKISRKGFTLAELLIVVAIIAVLVAVAIPVFGSQLEKSREAADLANVRAAYAKVLTEANMGIYNEPVTVKLKQKQYGWQSADVITIGGISHSVKDGDTENWIGIPGANGECQISFDQKKGTKFVWSGDGTSASNSYDMDENFFKTLESSGCLDLDLINKNSNFEIDSKASFSTFVPKIEKVLGEQSLLKNGTWAFLGNGYSDKASERYLFWTSFDTNKVGAKKKIPILIQTGDGKYYVSNSTTAERKNKSGTVTYVAISDHLFNKSMYNKVIMAGGGQVYSSLSEAYAAYEKELEKKEYKDYPSDYLQGYCLLRLP